MHKIFMNITIFLLIIIFIIAFSSNYSTQNINNLAYVLAIGIDKSDKNKLQVTFEFASTAASESGSSEKTTPIINSVDASSISNAINLKNIYIVGEISNFLHYFRSGHMYFTLKDDNSQLKAVMFSSNAERLKFKPSDGMKVLCRGRISVYD